MVRNSDAAQPSMIVVIPLVTNPVRYWTWEPTQSQPAGWGPKSVRQRSVSSTRIALARTLSKRWRGAPVRTGCARKRIGAVPGRRPMKRPPVSVGSLLAIRRSECRDARVAWRRLGRLRVEPLNHVGVLLVHDVALHLQGRRQLARLLGEVVGQDREALDLLDAAHVRVHVVDGPLDLRPHLLGFMHLLGIEPVLLGKGGELLLVERYQRDQIRPAIAHHHRLRDPAVLLQPVLEVGRGDVLAARRDDDVLLATGDVEEAVLVEAAEIAGVQPAVLERLPGGRLVLVVALEDVRALDQHLAVVADLDLHVLLRLADRSEAEVVRPVARGGGGRL